MKLPEFVDDPADSADALERAPTPAASVSAEVVALREAQSIIRLYVEALGRIARSEVSVFDDDLQTDVIVSMDADELSEIAQKAIEECKALSLDGGA